MKKKENLNIHNDNSKSMGLLGSGHGYLGLPVSWNKWIRFVFISLIFGISAVFSFYNDQILTAWIAIAVGVMFSTFSFTAIDD